MKIAVLGAGAGGQGIAAKLAMEGHNVTLYNRPHPIEDVEILKPLKSSHSINLEGVLRGTGRLSHVTNSLSEAVQDRDVVIISVPAVGHETLSAGMSPYVKPGQTIIFHPAQVGTAWKTYPLVNAHSEGVNVIVTHSLLFACRLRMPGQVMIHGVKKRLLFSAYPASETQRLLESVRAVFPQAVPASYALETELSNLNTILHPCIVLANMASVDSGRKFEFYREGVSPAVATLMKAVDAEKNRLAERLGLNPWSIEEFLVEGYGLDRGSLVSLLRTNPGYQGVLGSTSLDHRYVWEDVACGLVPIASLAQTVGVDVPLINALISVFGAVTTWDVSSERDLQWLGIKERDIKKVLEMAHR